MAMMLVRSAANKIGANEFQKLAQDLERRGFKREEKSDEQPMMYGAMSVASYKLELSGLELHVGGGREATDLLDAVRRQAVLEGGPVVLWARCSAPCDPKLAAFADIARHKLHLVRMGSRAGSATYEADLIPYPDAGLLISGSLRVHEAVARLGRDAEFASAVDAREAHRELMGTAGRIKEGNVHRKYVGDYLAGLLDALRNKFDYEFRRVLADPAINEALGQIADK
ncbi:MAG: hypothetical protein AB1324_00130 [Candidatus Micrarchaeota archaeon]